MRNVHTHHIVQSYHSGECFCQTKEVGIQQVSAKSMDCRLNIISWMFFFSVFNQHVNFAAYALSEKLNKLAFYFKSFCIGLFDSLGLQVTSSTP